MLNAKNQITDNWQFYAIGVIIIILIVVAITYYLDSQKTKSAEATELYSQAVLQYSGGNTQIALVTLNQLVDDFTGEEAAKKATYLLGNINLQTNNYPEAIRYFQIYTSTYSENKLNLAASYAGMATAYENQGQYTEAEQNYIKAVDVYPGGPLAGDYLYGAMRTALLNGNSTQAETYKNRIEDEFPNTDLARKAVLLFTEQTVQQ